MCFNRQIFETIIYFTLIEVSEYVCCCIRGNTKGKMKRSEGLKKSLDRLIKKSNINKGTTLYML